MKFNIVSYIFLMSIAIFPAFSQEIKVSIIDKETSLPIPFVTIVVPTQDLELFANKDGVFSLSSLKLNIGSSIVFSRIGYANLSLTMEELQSMILKKNNKLFLEPKTIILDEISIKPKTLKFTKEGNGFGSKQRQIGIGKDSVGCEIGTVIPVNFLESTIEKVTFRLTQNKYGHFKFKINIYKLENNQPSTKINLQPIYFEADIKSGICEINIKNYSIVVNNDFFLSIEYMYDMGKYSVYYASSMKKSPTFCKDSRNSKWFKVMSGDNNVSVSINTIQSHFEESK